MSNEQHCAPGKPAPEGGLHLHLRPRVHGSHGLVQDEDPGVPEEGACQTQELLLAQAGKEGDRQARDRRVSPSGFAACAQQWAPTTAAEVGGACMRAHPHTWIPVHRAGGNPVPPSHPAIFGQGDFRQPFKPAVPQLPIGGMAVSVSPWFHHVADTSSRSVRFLTQYPYNHRVGIVLTSLPLLGHEDQRSHTSACGSHSKPSAYSSFS